MGILWENTTPSTELPRDFCAGIGPLQLGVVLVFLIFHIDVVSRLKYLRKKTVFKSHKIIGKMAAWRITDLWWITILCKCNVFYILQVRVKYAELILGYMEKFFNNGSMTMKCHNLNVHEGLGGHTKDGRCVLSWNREICENPLN